MTSSTTASDVVRGIRDHRNEIATLSVLVALPFTPLFADKAPAGVLLDGMAGGALLVMHAVAVVLVFRTGRFLHLAQVPMALFSATIFTGLVNGAPLLRTIRAACNACIGPEPGPLATGINFWFATVITLAVAVLGAAFLQQTLFRRFSRAPRLMPTLVTIFLGQALIATQKRLFQEMVPVEAAEGTGAQRAAVDSAINTFGAPVDPPFSLTWTIGDVTLATQDVLALLFAIALPIGIALYLKLSTAGVAIRAASENPDRASTLGLDALGVTTRVWAIVGCLAAVTGMLIAYEIGAPVEAGDGIAGTLPIGPLVLVLAIAVAARLTNLPLTLAAGATLALVRTATQWSFGSTAPFDALLGLVVVGLLLLQRENKDRTDNDAQAFLDLAREARPVPPVMRSLPVVRSWMKAGIVVVAVLVIGLPWLATPGQVDLAGTFLIAAMIGLSLLILTGWAGQISLGQWGFATIGGWTAAVSGLPIPLAVVLAAVVGAIVSVVIGYPALKLRGLQLAIATLAFAYSAPLVFTDPRYLGARLPDTISGSFFGIDLGDPRSGYYLLLVLLVLLVGATVGLRTSRLGRALIAVRTNAPAAESYGIDPRRLRLTAFAVSGAYASIAGALFVAHQGAMVPASFLADESVQLFSFAVIGGLGGVPGPLLGALFLGTLSLFSGNELLQYLSAGVGGLILLVVAPGGLAEVFYRARDAALRRLAIRNRIPVASLLGDRLAKQLGETVTLRQYGADEKPALPPLRYELDRQWALERYGQGDQASQRTNGERRPVAAGASEDGPHDEGEAGS